MVIFWGSQSGTAESLAARLSREVNRRFGIESLLADLSDYDAASITDIPVTKIAVFILSTYGEGDPPDNANELWSWVTTQKDVKLNDLRYAAFGLGNSNYNAFNRAIDIVTKSLDGFGARALLPVGKADDAKGSTVEDFLAWQDELFGMLKTTLGYREQNVGYQPTLSAVYNDSVNPADIHRGIPVDPRERKKARGGRLKVYALPLTEGRELFSGSERSCLHLEFDLSQHARLKYKTGDHLAVWPQNPVQEVNRLLHMLGLQSQRSVPVSIAITEPGIELKYPTPTTLDALFGYYMDICGPMSRDLLPSLIQFAPSESSEARLAQLSSDPAAWTEYLSDKHINLGRLLEDLSEDGQSWTSIPLSFLLEYIPPLKPRYFSISSSAVVQPRRVSITALVSHTPINGNIQNQIPGLATTYLARLKAQLAAPGAASDTTSAVQILPPHHLHAHIQRSPFKLPANAAVPLILVASGTGIAPLRAFLAERSRLHRMDRPVGRCLLFYGARSAQNEWLYREEMEEVRRELGQGLFEIETAFSRDPAKDPVRKCYVQDRVRERFGDIATTLLNEGGYLYVCGSARMARGLGKIMDECFAEKMAWSKERYTEWAARMKRERKWQEDVWG